MTHAQPLPAAISDIILVQRALCTVLEEESHLLATRELTALKPVQERKQKLLHLLTSYQAYVAQHPEMAAHITPEEKAELHPLTRTLGEMLQKNQMMLHAACEVNRIIVSCVKKGLNEHHTTPVYTKQGVMALARHQAMSLSYNEMV